MIEGNTITTTAASAVVKNRLVTLAANRTCAHTALASTADGVALNSAATGERVTVRLKNGGGVVELEAAGAISDNAVVYGRADGKIDDTSADSAVRFGRAIGGASDAGSVIEVLPD